MIRKTTFQQCVGPNLRSGQIVMGAWARISDKGRGVNWQCTHPGVGPSFYLFCRRKWGCTPTSPGPAPEEPRFLSIVLSSTAYNLVLTHMYT